VRDVRDSFLDLYYQVQAEQTVAETRDLFVQLVDITRAHYASGRVSQQDVLHASLELSRLEDRATRIRNAADLQRATLAKWVGAAAMQPVAGEFPTPRQRNARAGTHPAPANPRRVRTAGSTERGRAGGARTIQTRLERRAGI